MTTKRILVTGGAGFIGQKLIRALLDKGDSICLLDNFSTQIHKNDILASDLRSAVEVIKGDIRDKNVVKKGLANADAIVHLAAETGTGQSMYEIEKYFSVNIQGTAVMLDLLQNNCGVNNLQAVVVASSRAVYGEGAYQCDIHNTVFPGQRSRERLAAGEFEPVCPICRAVVKLVPTLETTPFMPMSMYGLTKQVQEQAMLMFARTRGINGFGLRYQNVYGPGQSLKNPYTGILAIFSNKARQNQPIDIYEDGLESRDFVYIEDVVEATLRSINFSDQFVGALNVGSGQATSVMTVAQEIKAYFGSSSATNVTGAFRIGDIRHNIADVSKLEQVLGFVPRVSFKEGLANFLDWAIDQAPEDESAYLRSVSELMSRDLMGTRAAK